MALLHPFRTAASRLLLASMLFCPAGAFAATPADPTPESRFLRLPPEIVPFVLEDRFDAAESWARAAVAASAGRKSETTLVHAEALRVLAQLYLWRAADGDGERADTLVQTARPGFTAHAAESPSAWCDFLETEAFKCRMLGGFMAVRALCDSVLELRARNRILDPLSRARLVDEQARVLGYLGDWRADHLLAEEARVLRDSVSGASPLERGESLYRTGYALSRLSNPSEARTRLVKARALWASLLVPDHRWLIEADNILMVLADGAGDFIEARRLASRIQADRSRVYGPESLQSARSLYNLGILERKAGELGTAREHLEHSAHIRRASGSAADSTVACIENEAELARIELQEGRLADASRRVQRALDEYPRMRNPLSETWPEAHQLAAQIEFAQEHTDSAMAHAQASASLYRFQLSWNMRILDDNRAVIMAANQGATLDLIHAIAVRSSRAEDRVAAWDALIRARGLAFEEMAWRRRSDRLVVSTGRLQAIDRVHDLVLQLDALYRGNAPAGDSVTALIGSTSARLEREEEQLAQFGYDLRFEQRRRRAGFSEMAQALGPKSSVVGYAQYVDSGPVARPDSVRWYVAYVLREGDSAPDLVRVGRADEIDQLVLRWHREASTRPASSPQESDEAMKRALAVGDSLRTRIWDPVASLLTTSARVYVIPEGLLHFVNFDVLPGKPGRYLVEGSTDLRILTAERDLVAPETRPPGGAGIVILSDPAFDRGADSSSARASFAKQADRATVALRGITRNCDEPAPPHFQPVPGTRSEGRDIARLWRTPRTDSGSVVLLEGAEATKSRFMSLSPGHAFLHLATHGFVAGGACGSASDPAIDPMFRCGLALAGANQAASGSAGAPSDGILFADDVVALDLSSVDCVVLSACESGIGSPVAGEGVLGFRRSFSIAGAGSVVLSLWKVDDQAARTWMVLFHQAYLEGSTDPVAAVRAAHRRFLAQRRERGLSTHPFYGGAFIASGSRAPRS